ncbi:MAG: class I SAM-dependent methyltransferase [Marinilabiliales bacterium]
MKFLIKIFTRFIPRHHLQKFAHFFLKLIIVFYKGKRYIDPINGKSYRKFLPYGRINTRKNALSPGTMSLERHRLIWLYLKEKTDFFSKNYKFLHIAPEYCFIKPFKSLKNIEYTTGDLISPWADVKLDIMDIPFDDNSFDIIMCNHVLEHVDDDIKAMKEFYRVMRPGGWGIFQVPIDYNNEKTIEDPTVTNPREREKLFGQSDHVRLYGKDYAARLQSAGFNVSEENFINEIDPELKQKYALPENEIIYLCKKPLNQ